MRTGWRVPLLAEEQEWPGQRKHSEMRDRRWLRTFISSPGLMDPTSAHPPNPRAGGNDESWVSASQSVGQKVPVLSDGPCAHCYDIILKGSETQTTLLGSLTSSVTSRAAMGRTVPF